MLAHTKYAVETTRMFHRRASLDSGARACGCYPYTTFKFYFSKEKARSCLQMLQTLTFEDGQENWNGARAPRATALGACDEISRRMRIAAKSRQFVDFGARTISIHVTLLTR
jgi:hypothetical protein